MAQAWEMPDTSATLTICTTNMGNAKNTSALITHGTGMGNAKDTLALTAYGTGMGNAKDTSALTYTWHRPKTHLHPVSTAAKFLVILMFGRTVVLGCLLQQCGRTRTVFPVNNHNYLFCYNMF